LRSAVVPLADFIEKSLEKETKDSGYQTILRAKACQYSPSVLLKIVESLVG
jgi:hypothetical protein